MNITDWIECGGIPYPVFEPSIDDLLFEETEDQEIELDFVPASFEMEVF